MMTSKLEKQFNNLQCNSSDVFLIVIFLSYHPFLRGGYFFCIFTLCSKTQLASIHLLLFFYCNIHYGNIFFFGHFSISKSGSTPANKPQTTAEPSLIDLSSFMSDDFVAPAAPISQSSNSVSATKPCKLPTNCLLISIYFIFVFNFYSDVLHDGQAYIRLSLSFGWVFSSSIFALPFCSN